jgi:hypothetical protein
MSGSTKIEGLQKSGEPHSPPLNKAVSLRGKICPERIRDRLEGRIPTRWRPWTREINGFRIGPAADLILVSLSGKRLIWSGGGVWPPGGVHDFADEFLEDVFEGNHGLGLAVLVDEAGEVRAAGTQS